MVVLSDGHLEEEEWQADEKEQPRAKKLNIKVSVDSLKRKGEKSRASAARLKRSGSQELR